MQLFSYRAKNLEGQSVKGEVEARDADTAASLLRRQKLIIVSIKPVQKSPLVSILAFARRVRLDDTVLFTRQLSTMVAAGLPITDALRILELQARPAMAQVVSQILTDVEGGGSLSQSLEKRPKVFSKTYVSLVRAGESAGILDNILNRLADTMEKQKEFTGKVKSAMIYPMIVVIAMVAVSVIMMIFVIPQMTVMYQNFNAELPALTKGLMSVSAFFVNYWLLILGVIIGAFLFFKTWVKTTSGNLKFDQFLFRFPIIGKLRKFVILTEFSRTMGLLVSAGISIIDGLKITAEAVGSPIYREGLLGAARQVEKGLPLAVPLAQNPDFPPILSQMVSVGEETGKVDEVLTKISRYFESESEQGVATLTAAIEPLIMIVLGIGVGVLVIAVVLPIYNLTGSL